MQKGSFGYYLQVIFYDFPPKPSFSRGKLRCAFGVHYFMCSKSSKWGDFGIRIQLSPLLSNPGVKRKTIGFSFFLSPDFFLCSDHMKKIQLEQCYQKNLLESWCVCASKTSEEQKIIRP